MPLKHILLPSVRLWAPSPLRSHGQHLPWAVDSGLQDLPRESPAALMLSRQFWSSWPIPGCDFFTPETHESGNHGESLMCDGELLLCLLTVLQSAPIPTALTSCRPGLLSYSHSASPFQNLPRLDVSRLSL